MVSSGWNLALAGRACLPSPGLRTETGPVRYPPAQQTVSAQFLEWCARASRAPRALRCGAASQLCHPRQCSVTEGKARAQFMRWRSQAQLDKDWDLPVYVSPPHILCLHPVHSFSHLHNVNCLFPCVSFPCTLQMGSSRGQGPWGLYLHTHQGAKCRNKSLLSQ